MVGYHRHRFVNLPEALAEDLTCGECHMIYATAVDTNCRHTLCLTCLESHVDCSDKVCPICCKSLATPDIPDGAIQDDGVIIIDGDVVVTLNIIANKIIAKLDIACPYDCKQVFPLSLMAIHGKTCPFRTCATCGLTIDGQTLDGHNCIDKLIEDRKNLKHKLNQLDIKCQTLELENKSLKDKLMAFDSTSRVCNGPPDDNRPRDSNDNNDGVIETNWYKNYSNFDDMNLREELLRGINAYGFVKLSANQHKAIIHFNKGMDVIVQSQSGTGKTATFSVGILQQMDASLNECQALILAPNRELALDIQKEVLSLGQYMSVRCHASIGGANFSQDANGIKKGVHILVATPGRLIDMMQRQILRPDHIKMFVLVEAANMLTFKFKDQVHDIFKALNTAIQVILLSTSRPEKVLEMTKPFGLFDGKSQPIMCPYLQLIN